ncbi:hypothetical protein [Pedobacter sp.]
MIQYSKPDNCEASTFQPYFRCPDIGRWARAFTEILTGLDGWLSTRCSLGWKLKRTRFGRYYIQLGISVPKNRTGNYHALLPTPTTGSNRNSRNAIHRIGPSHQNHGLALGLAQVMEISTGILPKEFESWSQVPQFYRKLLPTPLARDHMGCRHPETLRLKGRRPSNSLGDTINSITGKASRLNSMFIIEMMGFPSDWMLAPFKKRQQQTITGR